MSKEYKQVICVRKDLNMRKGKIAAQAAHASLGVILHSHKGDGIIKLTNDQLAWITNGQTKICVSVDSEEQLLEVYQKACAAKLPCSIITDAGHTEFNGVPTKTAVAIGPAPVNEVDKITGQLKLL